MKLDTVLEPLIAGNDLSSQKMTEVMDQIMEGGLTPAQIGAFLTALRIKGETIDEIAAAAASMRRHATKVDAGPPPVVDIVGTGGDGAHTFNISTAAAFIAAGAGVKIAKHGNRSVSSQCGSADVLKALGVNLEIGPDKVGACIREVGIGFLFAPMLHGAMKHAIGPRREMGVRTIFNLLGPLTNPAGATALLLGVFGPELTEVHAKVLNQLGAERAMVVHGNDGLDEITGTTTTRVSELKNAKVNTYELDPRPYIGDFCTIADLKGAEATENAAILRDLLAGQDGPKLAVACLNAAAGIYVAGLAENYAQGYELAKAAINDGRAQQKLEAMIAFSNS